MKMSVTEWCLGQELQHRLVGTSVIRANVLRNTIRFQDPVFPGTIIGYSTPKIYPEAAQIATKTVRLR